VKLIAKNFEAKAIVLAQARDVVLPVSVLLVSLIIVVVLTGAGSLI
jgi:hypothetical protein